MIPYRASRIPRVPVVSCLLALFAMILFPCRSSYAFDFMQADSCMQAANGNLGPRGAIRIPTMDALSQQAMQVQAVQMTQRSLGIDLRSPDAANQLSGPCEAWIAAAHAKRRKMPP